MKKKVLLICGSLLLVISIILFNTFIVNPKQLHVRQVNITSNKIDSDLDGLKIAYFSDLHYGFSSNQLIEETIDKINLYKPDIIIFGGDLIDHLNENGINNVDRTNLIELLNKLESKYGNYAIIGNHDHIGYDDSSLYEEILQETSFKVLKNQNIQIYIDNNSFINLVGIDSSSYQTLDTTSAFYNLNSEAYTFVFSHTPDSFDEINGYPFDYFVAGHSHGGQIYIPLISYFTRAFGYENHLRGKSTINNKVLDISNGVGVTKINGRLNADSEIVIYQLNQNKTAD